ncbi:MAG: DUF1836 domain-containing protein [Firmicutes bacterium]|uniref:DUF1836 domain-containing protein n=1 Tax=Candidatus Gallilactobacillus intestinavium TaxID=2840838 RepID=A0A9D9E4V4_9LACO|nr:DUF1836 domain-containing protein [Candidatus Gallilactobacillus intestinavium]
MMEYSEWQKQLKNKSLPKWNELPQINLYMDQLIEYVNEILSYLKIDLITPSMVNNYVKHKVILAPVKKRYQTMQIADILLISLLKSLFSLEEIRSAINRVTQQIFPKKAYDMFIDILNNLLHGKKVVVSNNSLISELMIITGNMIVDKIKTQQILASLPEHKMEVQ